MFSSVSTFVAVRVCQQELIGKLALPVGNWVASSACRGRQSTTTAIEPSRGRMSTLANSTALCFEKGARMDESMTGFRSPEAADEVCCHEANGDGQVPAER